MCLEETGERTKTGSGVLGGEGPLSTLGGVQYVDGRARSTSPPEKPQSDASMLRAYQPNSTATQPVQAYRLHAVGLDDVVFKQSVPSGPTAH